MVGDSETYAQFADRLPELPLAYFEEIAPAIDLPATLRCAYLQLSSAYQAEADEAERKAWSLRRHVLHHLAVLTHPEEIATELEAIITGFGIKPI